MQNIQYLLKFTNKEKVIIYLTLTTTERLPNAKKLPTTVLRI